MTRNEFLTALRDRLYGLPDEEIASAVRYYEEYFDEAESEEAALTALGSPEQAAICILEQNPPAKVTKRKRKCKAASADKPKASPWKVVGIVVLVICASPMLIALGAVVLSLLLSLIVTVLCTVISILLPFIILSLVFLALMVLLGLGAIEVLPFFAPASTVLCGAALLCGSLGLLFTLLTVHLCRWTYLLFRAFFRALADKKGKKEVQPV